MEGSFSQTFPFANVATQICHTYSPVNNKRKLKQAPQRCHIQPTSADSCSSPLLCHCLLTPTWLLSLMPLQPEFAHCVASFS